MIGTLIGDLAAWAWENNKQLFYSKLVSYDIKPSVYGRALLNAASRNLLVNQNTPTEPEGQPRTITNEAEWLMWRIVGTWIDKFPLNDMPIFSCIEKEAGYASSFIYILVNALRNGATKSEAFHKEPKIPQFMQMFKWRNDVNPKELTILCYLFRAWDSFYRGFDFTSSIHNAMKWSGDKHLLGTLTGTFADAMYGCEYNFIKEKYAKPENIRTQIPMHSYTEHHGYHSDLANQMIQISKNNRTFYPKNRALTNVECHHWRSVKNPFDSIVLSRQDRDRILLSAPTDWECRFGMYLDDGWIYLYRSGGIIGRFQLEKVADGKWHFANLQVGERDFKSFCMGLDCAIYDGCGIPLLGKIVQKVEACKYYHGEPEMPKKWKETTEGHFWHGEMMFIHTRQDIDDWKQSASNLLNTLEGRKRDLFLSYSEEQRAIILYIETLFQKWCPMSNLDWIYEY